MVIFVLDVPWPEADESLSEPAYEVIDRLLNLEPSLRPRTDSK